jgi:tetratricopeptide (TPR) repeat protein
VRASGKLSAALRAHEGALEILRSLANSYPGVTQIRRDLANGLIEIGDVLREMNRLPEARTSYEGALANLELLVEADPTVSENNTWLIQCLKGLGATQFAEGRAADAVRNWRRAVAIGESLRSPYSESFYYLTGCHALLSRAAGVPGSGLSPGEGPIELERGMEMLRRAIAAGSRDVSWMRRDPDLGPLQLQSDFQLLMQDVAFPADPFARGE